MHLTVIRPVGDQPIRLGAPPCSCPGQPWDSISPPPPTCQRHPVEKADSGLTVEITGDMGGPKHAKIWRHGVLVFAGRDYTADLERGGQTCGHCGKPR